MSYYDTQPTGRVQEIQGSWITLQNVFSKWRARAMRNYRYVVDDQLTDEERKSRERAGRPVMEINILKPSVIYLAGLMQQTKLNMRAVPRNQGDENLASMHTKLVSDWAMPNCDGYRSFARATVDAGLTGMGWLNNYWDVWREIRGKWNTEAVDPFLVTFDPDTKPGEFDKTCNYLAYSGFFSAETLAGIYSKADPQLLDRMKEQAAAYESRYPGKTGGKPIGWVKRVLTRLSGRTNEYVDVPKDSEFADAKNGMYRVIEWHDKRIVRQKVVYSPLTQDSEPISRADYLDEMKRTELMQKYPMARFVDTEHEEIWITVVVPALLPNEVLMEQPYPVQGKGYQFKPIFCYDFHPDITQTTSILDGVVSTQDMFNVMLMSLVEYTIDTIDPPYDVPEGSINPEHMQEWLDKKRGALRFFNPKNGEKPEPQRPVTDKTAIAGLVQQQLALKEQLASINPAMQGYSENKGEGANLYAMKLQQGQIMLAALLGNLQQTMGSAFEYCDASLQKFMTLPRKIRLLDETNNPYWVPLNMPTLLGIQNDVSQGEYDFQPEQINAGPMQKQIQRLEMQELTSKVPPDLIDWTQVIRTYDIEDVDKMAQFAQKKMQEADAIANAQRQAQSQSDAMGAVSQAADVAQKVIPGQSPTPTQKPGATA